MEDVEIDFVIPWVDGSDPEWLMEKAKYDPTVTDDKEVNSTNRYRDWGLMKYWFRGVEKFAPWVRKIHFITWGHIPEFLDAYHPKVHIVNHKDFIPEDYLPTYSSSAIEVALNRIPDLKEHFVYFNDDMFILKPLKTENFFKEGLPCCCFEENPTFTYGNSDYGHRLFNDLTLVNKHFNKHKQMKKNVRKWFSQPFFSKSMFYTLLSSPWDQILGLPATHLPSPFLKSTWNKVWALEKDFLTKTMRSRFRISNGVQQDLFRFWQLIEGCFVPSKELGCYYAVTKENAGVIASVIRNPSAHYVCLNDCCDSVDFDVCRLKLEESFETLFPKKSSFEK